MLVIIYYLLLLFILLALFVYIIYSIHYTDISISDLKNMLTFKNIINKDYYT